MAFLHQPPPIPPRQLRQPPPPPPPRGRHLLCDDEEDRNTTEMVGDNCLSTRLTNIEFDSLPDKLVFDILMHLAAQDIYETARLVCPRWYHMIHTQYFIHTHLQHTTCGLIIQDNNCRARPIFVALRQGRIEISNFSYNFRHETWSSCNGLILERDFENQDALYIANPATKQHFVLPPFSGGIYHPFPCISYAAASMEYKVAVMHASWDGNSELLTPQFAVLTVGVDDSWRHVHTEHLSCIKDGEQFWEDDPIITEGFMHWVIRDIRVLTLNVETEIITETPIPQVRRENIVRYYLSTGRSLSMLIGCNKFSWEVWVMKSETGEWMKLSNIDLEAQKCTFDRFERYDHERDHTLIPVGWLKCQEVLVFGIYGPSRVCFAYSIHTREIDLFELDFACEYCEFVVHRNSLEWL